MKTSTLFLGLTLVVSTGCGNDGTIAGSGDPEPDATPDAGNYTLTLTGVPSDTCWADVTNMPPVGVSVSVDFAVDAAGTAFTLAPFGEGVIIHPPVAGAVTGDTLSGTGLVTRVVDASCSLTIDSTMAGYFPGPDHFDAAWQVSIEATPGSSCADASTVPFADGTPFPTLDASQRCDVSLQGSAERN